MEDMDDLFKMFLSKLSSPEQKKQVEDAMEAIATSQADYESVVLSHYENNEIFKPNREGKNEFESDLNNFSTLIVHTLRSGNMKILQKHGIDPIFRTPDGIKKLAAHNQLESYANVFARWQQDDLQTTLGKTCAKILEDECRGYNINSPKKQGSFSH
jgi:hypothetical protein